MLEKRNRSATRVRLDDDVLARNPGSVAGRCHVPPAPSARPPPRDGIEEPARDGPVVPPTPRG